MNATACENPNRTLEISKAIARAVIVCVFALALEGCAGGNSAVVGKWQGSDAADIMEFRADGTFHISGSEPMKGKYSVRGDTLELKLDGDLGKALGKMTARVVVEGDTLKMTADGETDVYKRVK